MLEKSMGCHGFTCLVALRLPLFILRATRIESQSKAGARLGAMRGLKVSLLGVAQNET